MNILTTQHYRQQAASWHRYIYAVVGLLSVVLFLKNAWVAEDAFILLRSVDQFLHGNGFRWNPHERAQVYTSPLWYLLVIASTYFCKTLYLDLIGLSLLLHVALLLVMAILIRHVWRWSAAVLLLTLSQAFFDFTASGLEYPLVYLLLGTVVLLYLRDRHLQDRYWLALCSGLALVTRHDLLFLLAPILLHLAWGWHKNLAIRQQMLVALIFIAPLTCWTLFSLIYYGFPFPNTAYAKLSIPGLPQAERFRRGFIYPMVSLKVDPITPMLIVTAMLKGFSDKTLQHKVIASSLLLASAYVTCIGGDYMIGRFYAPLYLVAILLLVASHWQQTFAWRSSALPLAIAIGYLLFFMIDSNVEVISRIIEEQHWQTPEPQHVMLVLLACSLLLLTAGLASRSARCTLALFVLFMLAYSTQEHDSPWQTGYRDWGKTGDYDYWWMINTVSRERYWIYRWTSLYAWLHRDTSRPFPDHPWCREGVDLPPVSIVPFAGMMPYCMGTSRIAVEIQGLTDPFIARMPRNPQAAWVAGGANRIIPDGYLESLASGENRIHNPDLARFYTALVLITQSDRLFSTERLKAIIAFNAGYYDYLLASNQQQSEHRNEPTTP